MVFFIFLPGMESSTKCLIATLRVMFRYVSIVQIRETSPRINPLFNEKRIRSSKYSLAFRAFSSRRVISGVCPKKKETKQKQTKNSGRKLIVPAQTSQPCYSCFDFAWLSCQSKYSYILRLGFPVNIFCLFRFHCSKRISSPADFHIYSSERVHTHSPEHFRTCSLGDSERSSQTYHSGYVAQEQTSRILPKVQARNACVLLS